MLLCLRVLFIHMPWSCLNLQVLCKLSSLSEASVTRRSAGLPLIIDTILASETHIKQVSDESSLIYTRYGQKSGPLKLFAIFSATV